MRNLIIGLVMLFSKVNAIKFAADGVTVPDGILRVNENAEAQCKYIMWKQERLASVTWSLQYPGVKADFFKYMANGNKEVMPGNSLVLVDPEGSSEKVVTLRLTDSREREISLCCHVMVLRDDGYGSMTTKQKEKCSSPIRVQAVSRRQERVTVTLESPESGRVGDSLPLVCAASGLSQYHSLKLIVNGVDTLVRDSRTRRLEYVLALQDAHFISHPGPQVMDVYAVTVECVVMQGRTVAANTTRLIMQEGRETPTNGHRIGIERNPRAFYDSAEAHQIHPEHVPCQSYLLVKEGRNGAILTGRLTDTILEDISNPSRTEIDIHQTDMTVVNLLNVLGFHGHRVVAVVTSHTGEMVWTLERQYYEFHRP